MFFPDKQLDDPEIALRRFALEQRIVPSRTGWRIRDPLQHRRCRVRGPGFRSWEHSSTVLPQMRTRTNRQCGGGNESTNAAWSLAPRRGSRADLDCLNIRRGPGCSVMTNAEVRRTCIDYSCIFALAAIATLPSNKVISPRRRTGRKRGRPAAERPSSVSRSGRDPECRLSSKLANQKFDRQKRRRRDVALPDQ